MAFLGSLVAGLLIFLQPTVWEGRALIGLGVIIKSGDKEAPAAIEDIYTAVERVKTTSFISSALTRVKGVEAIKDLDKIHITAKPLRGGETLLVTVTSGSSAISSVATDAIASELVYKHSNIAEFYNNSKFKVLIRPTALIEPVSVTKKYALAKSWKTIFIGSILGVISCFIMKVIRTNE